MSTSEWTGQWIYAEAHYQTLDPMEVVFDTPVTARYLQLNITELGLRASTDANYSFAQLSELEVYAGETNIARSATFTVGKSADTWTVGGWSLANLHDGKTNDGSALGWTTTQNVAVPVVVKLDFGTEQIITKVKLYPRQNDHATGKANNIAANFPAAFTLQTSTDGSSYTVAYTKESDAPARVPYFYKSFKTPTDKTIKRARIYASALGIFKMTLNGQDVTDAVLEPGESEYEKTILYSTYDVTSLVNSGENEVLARVAGGIYDIDYIDGRFSKGEVKNNGQTALLSELLIEYTDGTSERIVTDGTWLTAASPTLGSNWWGGEDYDARKIKATPSQSGDGWIEASVLTNPSFSSPHSGVSGFGTLKSRMYEPLRVVEEWQAVSVKTIQSGGYTLRIIDFGRNFAGQYRFRLKGRAGQTISLRSGENINADGSIFMENFYTGPADTYDIYTFAGDEDGEEWGPEFMYHGFRYLQIIGLEEEPSPEDFTALRIRSDMENVGTLETSNSLINDIHVICRDAIASQLYNSITDCPHREKLGWLDVPNEMYVSLNMNFLMQNFYKKVVLDCFDAQRADGRVPSVAPYYMEVYGDDTNWGGAAILVPYRNWRYYGDKSLMTQYYTQMKSLLAHYTANTTGYIINNSFSVLSDWGQQTAGVSPVVPTEFTETTTYYYLVKVMAEIATELGQASDATTYTELAANIKSAFNTRFYNAETGVYTSVSGGGGRQSEQAQPLYYGLVPDGDEAKVAAVLAARVAADGYKVKTGEIALKPVFMSLAKYGYNDVVWQMANQTDCPSYGYWVREGYTTTPEYWNVGDESQNHCMMDHIEEWFFTELAGIKNTSMGFQTMTIKPYIPNDLNSMDVTTACAYGSIRSAWQRTTDGFIFQFTIPAGTQASIVLPTIEGKVLKENGTAIAAGTDGIVSVTYGVTETQVIAGSGSYRFVLGEGAVISAADSETFWLPVHGNDELTADSKIRLQASGGGRFMGWHGSNTMSAGKFITGAAEAHSVTLNVTDSKSATIDGNESTLFTLQEQGSLLHLDGSASESSTRILLWSNSPTYEFGFQWADGLARMFRSYNGSARYVKFMDSGANSGLSSVETNAANAQQWTVWKQDNVMTRVNSRLSTATAGETMILQRTFAQGWNTLCLPFSLSAEEVKAALGTEAEVAAYRGTTQNEGDTYTVHFEVVTSGIEANTPYLVYVPQTMQISPAELRGTVTAGAIATAASATPLVTATGTEGSLFAFVGSYEDTNEAIVPGDYLLSSDNSFHPAAGGNRLRPFRAFMQKTNGGADVKGFVTLKINGTKTGLESILNTIILNGAGAVFDLSGRKISTLHNRGGAGGDARIYIQNGKKKIIK